MTRQLQLPLGLGPVRRVKGLDQFCLYCGAAADTREHVPPKALLDKPWPINLRTVPACQPCNRGWSLHEEYLAIVLAQLGDSPCLTARVAEGGSVDRALQRSPRLDDRIIDALSVNPDGRVQLNVETERVSAVAEKVAFGLHALKYGHGGGLDSFSCIAMAGPEQDLPSGLVTALWDWPGVRRKRWTRVQEGVFSFLFAKGWLAGGAPLYCFMNLHDTLLAVVSCPAPVTRAKRRLASPPW